MPLRYAHIASHCVARSVIYFAVFAMAAASAHAQTVYVDGSSTTASDLNVGSEQQPYRTINGALVANKGAGVTILVQPAVYREQVSVPTSGAIGNPFVFRATGPGVIMDGSDDLSGPTNWVLSSGSVFRAASADWATTQVLVDGVRLTPSTVAPALLPVNTFRRVAGEGLYVNLGTSNPGLHVVQVSRRSYAFTMSTKQFVTIDGFEVTRTNDRGINIFGCNDLVVANNKVAYANSYGIQAVGSQNVVIERNVVTDCNLHGIGLTATATTGSSGCVVRYNECARNAHPTVRQANGIYVSGSPGNTIHGNRLHHNQDSGMHFMLASSECVSYNNVSYANGDHGYDHVSSGQNAHVNDVAHGNLNDGFSFEGNSLGGKLFNCISVDNGLNTNGSDLWVDAASSVNFVSDHNLLWNSDASAPIRYGLSIFATVADFSLATGHDVHSRQANPMFANTANGDFQLTPGSPAIDAATSSAPAWPALDAVGSIRVDDPAVPDAGAGPVTFADMGALEFVPPADGVPVVLSPDRIRATHGTLVTFTVTALDPDGEPITSLTMKYSKLPDDTDAPTFVVSADNSSGIFSWQTPTQSVSPRFTFTAQNARAGSSETHIQVKKSEQTTVSHFAGAGESLEVLALSTGYPMPSLGAVDFTLSLPADANLVWGIYDTQGRRVWSETRTASAGRVRLRWTGLDMSGRPAATGIYFARVRVGGTEFVRRVVRF